MTFYRDINNNTPTQKPSISDVEAVSQSVVDILMTRPGERPFNPDYGINLEASIFELMDIGSEMQLMNEIIDKVRKYEPRVLLNTSKSEVIADEEKNEYEVSLWFAIVGFNGELFQVTQGVKR